MGTKLTEHKNPFHLSSHRLSTSSFGEGKRKAFGKRIKNKFSEATKSKSTSFSNQTDGNNESSYMSAEDMAGDLHRGLDDLTNLPSENGVLHPGDAMVPYPGVYRLNIVLVQGHDLAAKDKGGTSDPYVKFVWGKSTTEAAKSTVVKENCDPIWDEEFNITVDNISMGLLVRAFDQDLGSKDDLIGEATLDISKLELSKTVAVVLDLRTKKAKGSQGTLDLNVTLYPKLPGDDVLTSQKAIVKHGLKKQAVCLSIVNIIVIDGKCLTDKEEELLSRPYLRFRLGNEKRKTKVMARDLTKFDVTWMEQFDFHPLSETAAKQLEVHLCEKGSLEKDEIISKFVMDLSNLERNQSHPITREFDTGGSGVVSFIVSISGSAACESVADLSSELTEEQSQELEVIKSRYTLLRSFKDVKDVGHLTVKIFKATGLASADIGGKSDPFCVLQLVNSRLQTHTEYKTLTPTWNKMFTFKVKDIHSVLEVTVFDEDRDYSFDFLGTVHIPLLKILDGQKKWYILKDSKLRSKAKGNNARILMELNVIWNPIRAALQTVNPKEKKYIQPEVKFSHKKLVRNVNRIKAMTADMDAKMLIEGLKYIESCFAWESYIRSISAFIIFEVVVWYFEIWMLPLGILMHFLRNFIIRAVAGQPENAIEGTDDDDEDDKDKDEPKNLKERLQAIQDITFTVQEGVGFLASSIESVKNAFNFTVPFLSHLAIIALVIVSILLYAIPLRYLIMVFGVHKFTKKLLRPNAINNNELLDYISRVPDDEQLLDYREIRSDTLSVVTQIPAKTPSKKI